MVTVALSMKCGLFFRESRAGFAARCRVLAPAVPAARS